MTNSYSITTNDGKVTCLVRPGGWYETNEAYLTKWLELGRAIILARLDQVWDGEGEEGERAMAQYANLPTLVLACIAADCTPDEDW